MFLIFVNFFKIFDWLLLLVFWVSKRIILIEFFMFWKYFFWCLCNIISKNLSNIVIFNFVIVVLNDINKVFERFFMVFMGVILELILLSWIIVLSKFMNVLKIFVFRVIFWIFVIVKRLLRDLLWYGLIILIFDLNFKFLVLL